MTLEAKLATLLQRYETLHPLSKQAFDRAQRVLPAGNTRSVLASKPFPLVIQSAKGAQITTVDGLTFEDFVSDYTAGIYGHSHPVIEEAVRQTLSTGFSLGAVTKKEAQLAEHLNERFPSVEKVRFCNSGTEANTFALATAVAHTQRKKVREHTPLSQCFRTTDSNQIVVFDNGYHGGTISFGAGGNAMNLPHDFLIGRYNDIEETRKLLCHDIAAILVEPMQAAGGMRPASREFLLFLRQAADELGAVLIFDEVVTSRLHYHGLQGALDITPDMTTVGKYLGGGFPFGAFGGSAKIMDQFDSSDPTTALHHSGTFNNNIFTMSAAVAASKLVTADEIQRLNRLGDRLREQANEMVEGPGLANFVSFSGYGSAVGIHFSGTDADDLRDLCYFRLLDGGVSIGRRGFVSLNLMHTEESVDRFIRVLKAFLDDLAQESSVTQDLQLNSLY